MSDAPLDRIRIEGMRFHCIIGINDWERVAKQPVTVDLTLHVDLAQAAESDDIKDTVNYREMSRRVRDAVEGSDFGLIESLADRIARVCLDDLRVQQVDVGLRKPGAARLADSVGVEITRRR